MAECSGARFSGARHSQERKPWFTSSLIWFCLKVTLRVSVSTVYGNSGENAYLYSPATWEFVCLWLCAHPNWKIMIIRCDNRKKSRFFFEVENFLQGGASTTASWKEVSFFLKLWIFCPINHQTIQTAIKLKLQHYHYYDYMLPKQDAFPYHQNWENKKLYPELSCLIRYAREDSTYENWINLLDI